MKARRAYALDPNDPLILTCLGGVLQRLGRRERDPAMLDEAEQVLRRALERAPAYANAHVRLGNVLGDGKGDYGAAEAQYRKACRLDPTDVVARTNLGIALTHLGRWPEALEALDEALGLDAEYAGAHAQRGTVLRLLRRPEESLVSLDEAIRLDPEQAAFYFERGQTLEVLKRYSEARRAYERSLRLDPDSVATHIALGAMQANYLGDPDRALEEFEEALRLTPEDARDHDTAVLHHNFGQVYRTKGDWKRAAEAFRRAVEIDADYANAQVSLALSLANLGEYGDAIVAYERALALDLGAQARFYSERNMARVRFRLSQQLWERDGYAEAIEQMRRGREVLPDEPMATSMHAWYLLRCPDRSLRDPEEGRRLAEKALAANPDEAHYLGTMAVACYDHGEYERAVKLLERSLVRQDHGQAAAETIAAAKSGDRYFLAMALWQLGRKDEARETLAEAIHGVEGLDLPAALRKELDGWRREAEALIVSEDD